MRATLNSLLSLPPVPKAPTALPPAPTTARSVPTRRLSPAEFQILVAAHTLGQPTIREIRNFLATLPPLTVSLRRTRTPADSSRGIPPSYNTVNTLLLRMAAAGAVELQDQPDDISRRIVPRWNLEEALVLCVAHSLRDFLVWKPLLPLALCTVLEQVARQHPDKEDEELQELLGSACAAVLERRRGAVPQSPSRKRTTKVPQPE